jgi:NitT/TauT family transport system substrate-binding protein
MRRISALATIASGIALAAAPASAQTTLPVVRIGASPIDSTSEAPYGAEQGIFADNGITPKITMISGGSTIMAAMLAGDLDVGLANPLSIASAVAHSVPVQMIAPGALYSKKDAVPNLIVSKASGISSPKDLTGGTIAVITLGDFTQMSLFVWLESNGVARNSVRYLEIPNSEMGAALERGTVQAAIITEPARDKAMRSANLREFGDTYIAIAPEFATVVWFASKDWLGKNPDTATKLVNGIFATARWANGHVRETGEMLANIAKIDPEVVAHMRRSYYATSNDRRFVETTLTLAARYNMIPRIVTFAEYSAF